MHTQRHLVNTGRSSNHEPVWRLLIKRSCPVKNAAGEVTTRQIQNDNNSEPKLQTKSKNKYTTQTVPKTHENDKLILKDHSRAQLRIGEFQND